MAKGKKVGKYELGKTLGSGSFAKVKLGTTDDGKQYAVKIIEKEQLIREHMEEQLKREISIMKMLDHPNVVKLYDVLQTQNNIYLVLELVTGGELFDRIVQAKRFEEDVARRFFQQLVVALNFCHKQGVAHRDLKPENLLVDDKDNIKITDFGLANTHKAGENSGVLLNTICGTPNYVAPEVLKEQGYDGIVADVWSCGVILFVMLAGYLPFDDPQMNVLFSKIERGDYRMSRVFSEPAKDIIQKLLTIEPAQRITLDQVMKHPWFMKDFDRTTYDSLKGMQLKPQKVDMEHVGDEQDVNSQAAAPGALGAFELVMQLTMGTVAGLTAKTSFIKTSTRFINGGNIKQTVENLVAALAKLNANPKPKEESNEVKGFINKPKGLLTYSINLYPLVEAALTMVEVRRGRGDTLDFHELYRALLAELQGSIRSKEVSSPSTTEAAA